MYMHIVCDFLASKGSSFQNLFAFPTAGVKCRRMVQRGLPVLHRIVDTIFKFFRIIEVIRGYSEYKTPLKGLLGEVSSVATNTTAHYRLNKTGSDIFISRVISSHP